MTGGRGDTRPTGSTPQEFHTDTTTVSEETHPFPSPTVYAIPIEKMSALRDAGCGTLFQAKRTRPAGSDRCWDRFEIEDRQLLCLVS